MHRFNAPADFTCEPVGLQFECPTVRCHDIKAVVVNIVFCKVILIAAQQGHLQSQRVAVDQRQLRQHRLHGSSWCNRRCVNGGDGRMVVQGHVDLKSIHVVHAQIGHQRNGSDLGGTSGFPHIGQSNHGEVPVSHRQSAEAFKQA